MQGTKTTIEIVFDKLEKLWEAGYKIRKYEENGQPILKETITNDKVNYFEIYPFSSEESINSIKNRILNKLKETGKNELNITYDFCKIDNEIIIELREEDTKKIQASIKFSDESKRQIIFLNNTTCFNVLKKYFHEIEKMEEQLKSDLSSNKKISLKIKNEPKIYYKPPPAKADVTTTYENSPQEAVSKSDNPPQKIEDEKRDEDKIPSQIIELKDDLNSVKSDNEKLTEELNKQKTLYQKVNDTIQKIEQLKSDVNTIKENIKQLDNRTKTIPAEIDKLKETVFSESYKKRNKIKQDFDNYSQTIEYIQKNFLKDFTIKDPIQDIEEDLEQFDIKQFVQDEVLKNFTSTESRNPKNCEKKDFINSIKKLGIEIFIPTKGDKPDITQQKIIGKDESSFPKGTILETRLVGLKKTNETDVFYKAEVVISR